MNREDIIRTNPIEQVVRSYGCEPGKKTATGFMLKCPFHDDKNPSLSVDVVKGLFKCFGCDASGSVIDFVRLKEGLSPVEAMKRLSPEENKPAPPPSKDAKISSIYSYRDELGNELYQVVRMEPKDFRQRHQEKGQWVWNMQGVNRVLYNLPAVLKAKSAFIWIVEGEKDADNLKKCGFVATCNVGGAGKWMDGYTESLRGKEIILCGDNDEAGAKHVSVVINSISKSVKCIHLVKIPDPHKDASDFIATFPDFESAAKALFELFENATVLTQGVEVPVQTMAELELEYGRHVEASKEASYSLGQWLPSLRYDVRKLTAGELVAIVAGTSVGKTACLQNIAISAAPLPVLLFEVELPGTLTFERFAALAMNRSSFSIENDFLGNKDVDWKSTGKLNHIAVCSKPKVNTEDIERIIMQTELKTGYRPKIVLLDYIGLVQGKGNSRYEKLSNVAEELRVIAKATKTVIILASQTSRKKADDDAAVSLSDAKDSGSIENSASLVLGAWRDPEDKYLLHIKVLKNTKGPTGKEVMCNFECSTMRINERTNSQISQEDLPHYQEEPT